jgi:hypothetical protein
MFKCLIAWKPKIIKVCLLLERLFSRSKMVATVQLPFDVRYAYDLIEKVNLPILPIGFFYAQGLKMKIYSKIMVQNYSNSK